MSESKSIPIIQIVGVLIGFPAIATLISLLLLNQALFTNLGFNFFNTFWIIIIVWYAAQILVVSKILNANGWTLAEIGFSFRNRKTLYLFVGYFLFAIGLLLFIEMALASSNVDTEKLNEISSLTPKSTVSRVIFIVMAFVGGLAEEIVYRGFAIQVFVSKNINRWVAIGIASIPFVFQHGLKSLDQFGWFLIWGLVFGIMYVLIKNLYFNIIIHWLVVLSAMVAVLQVID